MTFSSIMTKRAVQLAALLITAVPTFAASAPAPLPSPLTLQAALGYAVEHNPSLLATSEQIREQEGVLLQARSRSIPQLAASGSYSHVAEDLVKGPTGAKLTDNVDWTADLVVSQVLYAGGSVRAGVKAQREQTEAAKLSYTAALNDTLLLVSQRYYDVLLNKELISVYEESVKLLEAELQRARDRRASGAVSDFEVLRAEVSLANAKPGLIRSRNNYRVSQDRLRQALGCQNLAGSESTELELQGSLEVTPFQISLADALSKARVQRPELLRQERVAKAAEEGVVVARSGYQPTLSAYAGYEFTQPSWSRRSGNTLDGWTAGLKGSWSVFDGRSTAGKVQQARSQLRQVQYATEALEQSVAVEVRQAYSSLVEAVELLASSNKVVDQALESLRLSQARYDAGTATQLDVLQARTSLTEARSNLTQAQHDHAVAIASLLRAMGRLAPGERGT